MKKSSLMKDIAIQIRNPAKQYRIGAREGYKTFWGTLIYATKALFRKIVRLDPKSAIRNPKSFSSTPYALSSLLLALSSTLLALSY